MAYDVIRRTRGLFMTKVVKTRFNLAMTKYLNSGMALLPQDAAIMRVAINRGATGAWAEVDINRINNLLNQANITGVTVQPKSVPAPAGLFVQPPVNPPVIKKYKFTGTFTVEEL